MLDRSGLKEDDERDQFKPNQMAGSRVTSISWSGGGPPFGSSGALNYPWEPPGGKTLNFSYLPHRAHVGVVVWIDVGLVLRGFPM
jgi:hypothetical protein